MLRELSKVEQPYDADEKVRALSMEFQSPPARSTSS
jgi:hypothetical protein